MTALSSLATLMVAAQYGTTDTPPNFVLKFMDRANLGLAKNQARKGVLFRGNEWKIGTSTVILDESLSRIVGYYDWESATNTHPRVDPSTVEISPKVKLRLTNRANEVAKAVGYPYDLRLGTASVSVEDDQTKFLCVFRVFFNGVPFTSVAFADIEAQTYRLFSLNVRYRPTAPKDKPPTSWNRDACLYAGFQAARQSHGSKSLYFDEPTSGLHIDPETGRYGIRTRFFDKPNGVDATHLYDALIDPKTAEVFWSDDFPVYEGKPRPPFKLGPISSVYASKAWLTTGKGLTKLAIQPNGSSVEVAIRRKDLLQTAKYFPEDKALVASDGTYKVPDDIAKKLSGKSSGNRNDLLVRGDGSTRVVGLYASTDAELAEIGNN